MVDAPGERKIHSFSIPRCGGIAISIGAVAAVLLVLPFSAMYYSLLIGGAIIVVFGIADDVIELNYKWKFLGQIIAVCFVISEGVYIRIVPFMGADDAPLIVSYALTFFFVVGATNAVNLSDGLDGLAAGVMLLSLACIVVLAVLSTGNEVAIIALAIMGGIFGFLHFNTYPASIFMGDTGSQFIGFMGAFLAILLTQNVSVAYSPGLPLLILGLPILDTLSVIVQRIRCGRSPFSPDKRHIHHKLLVYGFSHEQSVVVVYLLQSIFLSSAFILRYAADWEIIGVYLLISINVLGAFYLAGTYKWKYNLTRSTGERRRSRLRAHTWLFSFCRVYIEYAIIIYLTLLLLSLWFLNRPTGFQELIFLFLSLAMYKWMPVKAQNILIRISVYNSVLYSYFAISQFPSYQAQIRDVSDVFFFLLLVVVLLAIQVTRRCYFKLTTQDSLIALFMSATLLLVDGGNVLHLLFYLVCIGYALEYLFQRDIYIFRFLRVLVFFSIMNFSVFFAAYY